MRRRRHVASACVVLRVVETLALDSENTANSLGSTRRRCEQDRFSARNRFGQSAAPPSGRLGDGHIAENWKSVLLSCQRPDSVGATDCREPTREAERVDEE